VHPTRAYCSYPQRPAGPSQTVVALMVFCLRLPDTNARQPGRLARGRRTWVSVALAAVLMSLAAVVMLAGLATGYPAVVPWAGGACVALLPAATGAAVLPYRLYDLYRIISRTLAYGLLSVLLGGGYAGMVLGLGQLVGTDSGLVVALATLALAAVFQPALRRIQQLVDRRFNRRRYHAAQTIQAFGGRLRQQVDLEPLTAELLAVVDQTLQPTQVSLWLRPTGHHTTQAIERNG
jgi:hypothetical protein